MERRQQIEPIFQEALQRPAAERDAFLRQDCGGDADLLREVQSLMAVLPSRLARERDSTKPRRSKASGTAGCTDTMARLQALRIGSTPPDCATTTSRPDSKATKRSIAEYPATNSDSTWTPPTML